MADFDEGEYAPSAGDYVESGGGGNFLTNKLGPLPTWAWIVIAVVGGYILVTKMGIFGGSSTSAPSGGQAGDGLGGTYGITDSSGNASDVLTALEAAMSMQAATIEKLKAADKKDAARDKKQQKEINRLKALLKKKKK